MVYDHRVGVVMENEKVKLLWDVNIHTDKLLEHRRLDVVE